MGRGNSKVEKDSANRRNPESFQYGREVREVVTGEAETAAERLQEGLRRSQRDRIAIDPDELGPRCRREDERSVPGSTEGSVNADPAVFQRREEKLDDPGCKDRSVSGFHKASML